MENKHQTILIVEDEDSLLSALTTEFTSAGFHVLTAGDGEEGLRVALAEKPALILADVLMPKMDGIQMLHALREDPYGKDVPVVVLTNVHDTAAMVQALEHHAFDYLVKSDYTPGEIVAKVKKRLGIR